MQGNPKEVFSQVDKLRELRLDVPQVTELAYELKDDIPAHIGLIAYFPNSNTYRVVKECVPQEVSPEAAARLLYNAFKKWVDKFQDDYWSTVHKTEYVSHHFGKPTQGEILW